MRLKDSIQNLPEFSCPFAKNMPNLATPNSTSDGGLFL